MIEPYAVATRGLLRETLLRSVSEELRTRRWAEVTMADVARTAGVSRQTVYNEFGTRGALAQEYVLWEGQRFLSAVSDAVHAHLDDPVAALTAAFETFLEAAREDPLVRAVASGAGGEELLALVTTQGGPLHEQATAALAELFAESFEGVADGDARLLADAVVRLAISHATLPGSDSTAESLGRLLGPFVERALGGSS